MNTFMMSNVNDLQGCFNEPPVELRYQDYVKVFQGLSLLRLGVVFLFTKRSFYL